MFSVSQLGGESDLAFSQVAASESCALLPSFVIPRVYHAYLLRYATLFPFHHIFELHCAKLFPPNNIFEKSFFAISKVTSLQSIKARACTDHSRYSIACSVFNDATPSGEP